MIALSDIAARSAIGVIACNSVCDLHICSSDRFQCFPFYTYNEDGSDRRENITDWAQSRFRERYGDDSISKWDIFYYVYGILHHPEYRARYAENLKRELPRIPLVGAVIPRSEATRNLAPKDQGEIPRCARDDMSGRDDNAGRQKSGGFWAVSRAGKELADLHINYERSNLTRCNSSKTTTCRSPTA